MNPTDPAAPPPPERIIEAMLFVGGEPLTAARAAEVIRGATPELFAAWVEALNRDYRRQARPYRVTAAEGGYQLALTPRYRPVWERLFTTTREARLSPAALDVLALVAYRQPVTRPEVEAARGLDSSGPLRQLVRLGLVAVQRGEADARDVCYATTARFLSLFGLAGLDELPRTQELQRL